MLPALPLPPADARIPVPGLLIVRTHHGDDGAWEALVAAVRAPVPDSTFLLTCRNPELDTSPAGKAPVTELLPFPQDDADLVEPAVVDDGQEVALPGCAERIRNSWSPSTRAGYSWDWEQFTEWCASCSRTTLPATDATLASYTDHLANKGLAPATIDRALGAISSHHEAATGVKAPMKAARMVLTVTAWIGSLAENGITTGPLLRSIDRHGRLVGTPDAAGCGTGRMSGAGINLVVKKLAETVELEGVTAHSLRAGPATATAASGAGRAWIARQGRWSEKSTAVDTYIRPVEMWKNHPLRNIGL